MAGLPPINPPGASLQRGPDGQWFANPGPPRKRPRRKGRPLGSPHTTHRPTGGTYPYTNPHAPTRN